MSSKDQELYSKLSIRPINSAIDADDFFVWASDDLLVTRFCTWDSYKSKEQAIEYINDNAIKHPYFKVICLNNKAIRAISLTLNDGNDKCRGELGYGLAREYWGRGIAMWAAEAVVSTVFEERLELERVETLVDLENSGSEKVLEKVGFVKEGVLKKYCILKGKIRDMIIFSFLREDKP
ncbi:hypothetical protein RND81_12G017700 [Saponaria officinalis]|uniref:N-acetyltransferase domain-containing protein n=1 Tax=Saponaria officinalis TaxID=3572 RepID=A0AAW1H744_SAPOF